MKKNKIFLLEDNPIHREVIFDGLEDAGYEVKKAQDVDSAEKILKAFIPDLFLFDIVIGIEKNKGIQYAETLHKNPRFKNIPVLYISAHLNDKNIGEYLPEESWNNVLPKPFDFDQLLSKIKGML